VSTPEQAADVTRRQYETLRAREGLDPALERLLQQQIEGQTEPR
jgi:hypothetical protein